MRKLFLTAICCLLILNASYAQQQGRMSIGIDAGLPLGVSSDNYSVAIGGSLKTENPIAGDNFITISFGYTSLATKQITNVLGTFKSPTEAYLPLKLGIKYNLTGGLYAEGQIGGAFEIRGRRSVRFVYAPGLVYNFNKVDLGVRYEGWAGNGGAIQQAALRLGYTF